MITYLYVIGIAQGALLSINFWQRDLNRTTYRWLSGLILIATLLIISSWITHENLIIEWYFLHLLLSGFIFLLGPFLFLYIQSSVEESFTISRKTLFHLIPILLYYVVLLYFIDLENQQRKIYPLDYELHSNFLNTIVPFVKILHLFVYTLLSSILLFRAKNVNLTLKIQKYFIAGYTIFQFSICTMLGVSIYFENNLYSKADQVAGLILAIGIYILGFISLQKTDFPPASLKKVIKNRYKTTGLSKEDSKFHYKNLLKILEEQELYLDSEINLKNLSSKLNISPHQLSQSINENSEHNFSSLINYYRVEKFKKLLTEQEYQSFTLLAIAFEVGFNNKNSFNQAFKKFTGKTPSSYRKEILNN